MGERPTTELEFSPQVIEHLQGRGLCVHGEVAVFGKSIFIDHVGHTGPCHDPEYVVAVEMKRRSDPTLRRQVWKLDIYHVADEVWGAVIANPRASTVAKWDTAFRGGRWSRHGLLSWSPEGLRERVPAERKDDKYLHKHTRKLLLCEDNRGQLAGYPSGDHDYCTHYKLLVDWVARQLARGVVAKADMVAEPPPCTSCYASPARAIGRALRQLSDEGRARKVARGEWALVEEEGT